MSRLISELLGASEPLFSIAIKQLEQASGKPGVDVRLTAEIISQVNTKIQQLNLDPKDTTGNELYAALLAKYSSDSDHFNSIVGIKEQYDSKKNVSMIIEIIKNKSTNNNCWVLKKSVAKDLLKQMPPANVMALLGHKSLDSMLKNESIFEIYGAIRIVESTKWQNKFIASYKKLKPSDFETRKIEIINLTNKKWQALPKKYLNCNGHGLTHLKELGAVIILPTNTTDLASHSLMLTVFVLKYINEIRLYSSKFKLQQVKSDFGQIIVDSLITDSSDMAELFGQKIHWRVIYRLYSNSEAANHPEIFEPHVQAEDLYWRKAEDVLFEIDQNLGWWRNLDYIGINDQAMPVSFNILDVALNSCKRVPYNKRLVNHFRVSLWNELFVRYMGEKSLEQQIFRQLNNKMVIPDNSGPTINGVRK